MNVQKFLNHVGKDGNECRVYRTGRNDQSFACETGEDKDHFYDLSKVEKDLLIRWLKYNLLPASSVLEGHTSYGMKHVLERRTGVYLTNNQFKELTLLCGFFPAKTEELNWEYRVSKKSPMFQMFADGKDGIPLLGDPISYGDGRGLTVVSLE